VRDLHQLLREKELEITRVRQEIEALRSVLHLLTDDEEPVPANQASYSLRGVNRE
jgi:hypothetical protein